MKTMQRAVLAGLAFALVFLGACHRGDHRGVSGGSGGGRGIRNDSCNPPGHGNGYGRCKDREFKVSIYTYTDATGSHCEADWPVATLWNLPKYSQTVLWISDDNNGYQIDFSQGNKKQSPFKDPTVTITVPAGGETSSGALSDKASGYYTFAILDAKGNTCKPANDPSGDPGYYVHP